MIDVHLTPSRRALAAAVTLLLAIGALVAVTARAHAAPPPATPSPGRPANLAATPPMGWNDWYAFHCDLDEKLVEQTADTIVSSGMKAAGYDYVNLDDCWASHQRDADGNLQADPTKFPHGIKAVADYVHSLGLKFGIYEDVGTETCAGYPGSYGHVQQDADTFASWGVDFAKIDWCNVPFDKFPGMTQQQVAKQLYTQYSQALQATGRPILFSICEWDPTLEPWTWAPAIANMWRTSNDYGDDWAHIVANLDQEAPLAKYAGPGHWNDPDILQVGLGGMSTNEDQAHFSAWSMLAAPLQAGNDLRTMSAATKRILTNRDVIAIDQDPLGRQARRIAHSDAADVWVRPLANGDHAVMLFNRGTQATTIRTTARAAGLPGATSYTVRNLWTHTTTESAGTLAASVPGHSAVLYRVSSGRTGSYPPATHVTVTPQVPPAYDGSTYRIATPGRTVPVRATLTDDGTAALRGARLSVSAPDGWTVSGTPPDAATVTTGDTLRGTWRVTVPADVKPGVYDITATGTYHVKGMGAQTQQGAGSVRVAIPPPAGTSSLSGVSWLDAANGYGPVLVDKNYYGGPLTVHGTTYDHGLWVNAPAAITYYVGGKCSTLTSDLGLDDSDAGTGTVDYQVVADGKTVYDSGTVTNATPTIHLSQDVSGANIVQLVVTDAGDGPTYDNADWAGPTLTCST